MSEELADSNVDSYDRAIKEIFKIITVDEIKEILTKYDIGKKPLSLLLNFGETTIIRYLEGQKPDKAHSDILKSILNSPFIMERYLLQNRDKLTDIAFKKAYSKVKQLELSRDNSKIYTISRYVIDKTPDITPLALQKILYFIQGFSKSFLNYNIFNDTCEAWKHGPVYRKIYDSFCYYEYKCIDKFEIEETKKNYNLPDTEKEYIDSIIKYFGCYSGEVLRRMSHFTEPWIKSRKNLSKEDSSHNKIDILDIDKYFSNTYNKYKMESLKDLEKYSTDLFDKSMFGN